ncbi:MULTISPECIES: hypothetical protein [Bacteria]|uniref:COG4315 family predicted lipoprotein n=1 Tax=Bacteria TaxID=2 RepID=UPI003C7C7F51
MKRKVLTGLVVASITALALTACTPGTSSTTGSPSPAASQSSSSSTMSTSSPSASGFGLVTKSSSLGTIVTDNGGRVVYQYDKDTQGGPSTCSGECAANWPAVPGDAKVALEGITGKVGTTQGTDGKPQLTLNGWPLYYFAGDKAAGDTKGQDVAGVWFVLTPSGEPIRK